MLKYQAADNSRARGLKLSIRSCLANPSAALHPPGYAAGLWSGDGEQRRHVVAFVDVVGAVARSAARWWRRKYWRRKQMVSYNGLSIGGVLHASRGE